MSSACYDQNCGLGCCNLYGYCPLVSGTVSQTSCYYYYNYYWDIWTYWWIYFVIVAGCLVFITIIACVVGCVRGSRSRYRNQDTIIINDSPSPYSNQNQGYNMDNNTAYMGQPVYNNNYQ